MLSTQHHRYAEIKKTFFHFRIGPSGAELQGSSRMFLFDFLLIDNSKKVTGAGVAIEIVLVARARPRVNGRQRAGAFGVVAVGCGCC